MTFMVEFCVIENSNNNNNGDDEEKPTIKKAEVGYLIFWFTL